MPFFNIVCSTQPFFFIPPCSAFTYQHTCPQTRAHTFQLSPWSQSSRCSTFNQILPMNAFKLPRAHLPLSGQAQAHLLGLWNFSIYFLTPEEEGAASWPQLVILSIKSRAKGATAHPPGAQWGISKFSFVEESIPIPAWESFGVGIGGQK